ncbi:hypothetical protein [Marinicellulosiphila megalodicopiae]|uniref:hypothetical protein n=1 Tax=Marinicellulosiphila megalodicopiae TaxID=2724896 RepID=UPI003BB1D837
MILNIKKILLILILLAPLYSISKGLEFTGVNIAAPYAMGINFLNFDEEIAASNSLADYGFAMGGNFDVLFNNRFETSIGYNYTYIGDRQNSGSSILNAHIFYFEAGLIASPKKRINWSILLGTEKIFISRNDINFSVPEGLYLKPLVRFWGPTQLLDNNFSTRFGFYIDCKISITESLLGNQFSFGITTGL